MDWKLNYESSNNILTEVVIVGVLFYSDIVQATSLSRDSFYTAVTFCFYAIL